MPRWSEQLPVTLNWLETESSNHVSPAAMCMSRPSSRNVCGGHLGSFLNFSIQLVRVGISESFTSPGFSHAGCKGAGGWWWTPQECGFKFRLESLRPFLQAWNEDMRVGTMKIMERENKNHLWPLLSMTAFADCSWTW